MERVTRSFPATAGTNLQELAYGTACLEGEKKSLASGIGRPNGLPHHWKHTTCIGGAGGFACESGFFHSFLGSGYELSQLSSSVAPWPPEACSTSGYNRANMLPNPALGVFFHWLGGLASGSFYVPYRGVKHWAWETYWLVGGFFSWIIAPWLLAMTMTSDLIPVLR